MTNLRRFSIIAMATILVAGCGANQPTTAPSSTLVGATAEPASTTEPVVTASPEPVATASPRPTRTPGCMALADTDLSDVEVDLSSVYPSGSGGLGGFSIGRVGGVVQVSRIEELSGERLSAVPTPRQGSNDRGLMLGGREFVTYPSTWFDGHSNPQAMIDARVTLKLDGASPIDLPTRFVEGNENFDQVAVVVPDVAGPGSITLDFVWADACFRYEGSSTILVDVVPLEQTARCELDERGYWDQLESLLDDSITVGGVTPGVGSPFNDSKYTPFSNPGIDAFLVYGFDADAHDVVVAAGGAVRIENLKPQRLELGQRMKVVIWTRRSVAAAVRDYPPQRTVEVFSGRLERQADGAYVLAVPVEPGRYVVGLSVEFDSRCSTGTLWAVVNVTTT